MMLCCLNENVVISLYVIIIGFKDSVVKKIRILYYYMEIIDVFSFELGKILEIRIKILKVDYLR